MSTEVNSSTKFDERSRRQKSCDKRWILSRLRAGPLSLRIPPPEEIKECIATPAPVSISVTVDQQYVDKISDDLQILWKVESNTEYFDKNKVQLTLKNTGLQILEGKNWELYFDTPMMVEPDFLPDTQANLGDQGVKIRHSKGTHYIISPTDKFIDLMPGTERKIQLHLSFWTISRTDSFPNWYLKFYGFDPRVINNTAVESLDYVSQLHTPKQWKRATTDKLNPFTAQERYRRYFNEYRTNNKDTKISIIPKPVFIRVILGGGDVTVDSAWLIEYTPNLLSEATYLKDEAGINLTNAQPTEKVIRLIVGGVVHPNTNENLENGEAYKLEVNAATKEIEITGKTKTGVFNGIQSFLSLYSMGGVISTLTIVDQPRFQYRGMHIDVGRNFHSKSSILKLLDAMAMVKLNKLHFHLSDDEGWRLEIPGLPELTELGSGPYTPNSGSGYYSVADYQEILRYASTRHIQVIPEFDMPGHARAAIKAMEKRYNNLVKSDRNADAEEYLLHDPTDKSKYWSVQFFDDNAVSPCINSTYKFLGHVIDELIKLHKDIQPLKMYHFGGDEVGKGAWVNSSKCQELSTGKRGLNMAAWEDGMMKAGKPFNISDPTSKDSYAYIWNNIWEWGGAAHAYNLANAGYKVIMCQATHLYFDHPYEPDPEERGYYWAPRFTDTKKTFSFMPDDVYQNIDFTRFGDPLDQKTFCKDEETCPTLTKPENIIGMQGHLWSETVRTPEELQYMIFPRILAIGERAWHKADWETIMDKTERDVQIDMDWARFSKSVGLRYLFRLERLGIKYRISPPGGTYVNFAILSNC
ncbi:hypothetical protein LOTGIDRAFT_174972 [Lottia gigantea]|uniref:beta-N-acetylhexosaminidase n=1 Tax=Lottia gigantea TaxID=225164 RepID=V3ZWU0_LOTGI|nr:hypothetical protein LOTGIDRAFT_174972 [Lottia gigantea]ESO95988.1 hypothetical protein LOTGIDRAFT_174972 [Lottia gigantea]